VVTFRFYVVSIVAFFLALAVGVVLGSVLDERIADSLQDRLDGVEASLDETVAAIDDKNAEIERLERYIEASAPFAVQGRLRGTAGLVVAEAGIDGAAVEDQVRRLRDAGSRVEGIVWLEPRWDLGDDADREAAAELVGLEPDAAREDIQAALREQLLGLASGSSGEGEEQQSDAPTTTDAPATTEPAAEPSLPDPGPGEPVPTEASTTEPSTTEPATTEPTTTEVAAPLVFDSAELRALVDAGLIRLQNVDGDVGEDAGELVLVAATGPGSTLARPGAASVALVRSAAERELPSVLAEVPARPDEGEQVERGTIIAAALESGPVGFSTVDDLDLIAGRVATALALAEGRDGRVGRYGYGPDVDGVLPPWQGP
jgi:hypothetical protein